MGCARTFYRCEPVPYATTDAAAAAVVFLCVSVVFDDVFLCVMP